MGTRTINSLRQKYHPTQSCLTSYTLNIDTESQHVLFEPLPPQALQRRRPLRRRVREPRLHKHFLQVIRILVELLVQDIHLLDGDTVREHEVGVELAVLDHLQEGLPVHVHGGLAVADEADATLHEGADVEVVGLLGRGGLAGL